jgi:arginase
LLALRRRGRYGLAYLDGHADFQHPDDEPKGEVASLELALATGRGPAAVADLNGLGPLVRDEDVAVVGYRVVGDNDRFGGEDIRSTAIGALDLQEVRRLGTGATLERVIATVTGPGLHGFWVHLDGDVLGDELMPAVDYRHPDGLSWDGAGHRSARQPGQPGRLGDRRRGQRSSRHRPGTPRPSARHGRTRLTRRPPAT